MTPSSDATAISVIICTYNRADSLRVSLDSLRQQPPVPWELIVVDNNSTDHTRAVCEQFQPHLPLRYLFEPRQGKSFALNHGVRAATYPLLAFTDDDVTVATDWLTALVAAAQQQPQATYFGGKILPAWLAPPPAWLQEHVATLIRGPMVYFDRGDIPGEFRDAFWGANLAIRRKVFDTFSFREDLGPNPNDFVRGEEIDLQQRLVAAGYAGWYVPNAVVYHRTPAERMTEQYIRHWFEGAGAARVRVGNVPTGPHLAGVPLEFYWRLFHYHVRYLLTRRLGPSRFWLTAAVKAATTVGMIRELRRRPIPPP